VILKETSHFVIFDAGNPLILAKTPLSALVATLPSQIARNVLRTVETNDKTIQTIRYAEV